MTSINKIAIENFNWVEEMGWHNKLPLESLALIMSEVGEAVNECRNGEVSENLGEELADIILRTLDFALVMGIDIEKEIIRKMKINVVRKTRNRIK